MGERHPTQRELLESAVRTIEAVLMPELRTAWARASALGLVGQLRYALTREGSDSLAEQDAELTDCIEALLRAHPELRAVAEEEGEWGEAEPAAGASDADSGGESPAAPDRVDRSSDPSWQLRSRAGRLLVFALDREDPAAEAIRSDLRPLLIEQAGGDLAESGPMLGAFLASGSLGHTG